MPPPQSKNNRKMTDFFRPVGNDSPATATKIVTPSPSTEPVSSPLSSLGSPTPTPTPMPTPGPKPKVQPLLNKQGKPRVIPSSDGEESSDDSDLEDPFGLFSRIPAPKPPVKKSVLDDDDPLPIRAAMHIANYKSTMPKLLRQREKEKALDEELRLAYNLIEESERKEKEPQIDPKAGITEETAQKVMGTDGSGARLMEALDRDDSWGVNCAFFEFFDHKMMPNRNRKPFPVAAVKKSPACTLLENPAAREQMFLNGAFVDICGQPDLALPDEVLLWIMDEVCLDQREDMVLAYYKTLLGHQDRLVPLMSVEKMVSLFELLGASATALDLERQLQFGQSNEMGPDFGAGVQHWRSWNIIHMVKILETVGEIYAVNGDAQRTQSICSILIRMSLDDQLSRQSSFLVTIEAALYRVLQAIPDDVWDDRIKVIGYNIMSTILKPQFRARVLNILPLYSQTLHLFRRRLACAFLYEDASYLIREYLTLVDLDKMATLLGESQFKITRKTEYVELNSLIRILEIAVDSGATSGTPIEQDKGVDRLVELLRAMFTRIIDTNARDLARTVAKDAIERFQFRLNFAVRSKRRQALGLSDGNQRTLGNWVTK
ncbi:hypothetical protein BZA05DRAFT_447630 [Tricharina praecox]|uniref:uncharacterized protein n=1 Tax=Tricharina praecox TaxID=43433 RepID=UPI0022211F6E|nr:uncharacterized protein BZA05DRAFT_447630 [Tricharina praecox]KAI5846214.1 hypothetical protein BZA05DRAFT_447630 [Tricharina praecox]